MAEYIHKPSDEAELFDFDNMADLVNHFSGLVIWLSEIKKKLNGQIQSLSVLNNKNIFT